MGNHELKVWPPFYGPLLDGSKTFEYRYDDRGFQVGDTLTLREWDPITEEYTGRATSAIVVYILRNCPGLPSGHCIMQLDSMRNVSWR